VHRLDQTLKSVLDESEERVERLEVSQVLRSALGDADRRPTRAS